MTDYFVELTKERDKNHLDYAIKATNEMKMTDHKDKVVNKPSYIDNNETPREQFARLNPLAEARMGIRKGNEEPASVSLMRIQYANLCREMLEIKEYDKSNGEYQRIAAIALQQLETSLMYAVKMLYYVHHKPSDS